MQLRPDQIAAVEFGLKAGRWIDADTAGSGKTAVMARWLQESGAQRTLVVAPLQVQAHWRLQLMEWSGRHSILGNGGTPSKRQEARDYFQQFGGADALIVGYDAMRIDCDELLKMGFDTIVVDEAHKLKGRSSQQTRAARKLAKKATRLGLITGTPVMNAADELWSLLSMVRPEQYTSFWRWARSHFEIETPDFGWSLQPVQIVGAMLPGHDELIREETRPHLLMRDLTEGLPPVDETVLEIELAAEERKAYDALMKKDWAQLAGRVVQTTNAVSRMTRARQITSDWGSIEEQLPIGSKVAAAVQLVQEMEPRQVIVLAHYRAAAERLAEELGGVLYVGGMTERAKAKALCAFRCGDARVFAGTIGAVGEGIDGLQVAADLVLLDRDWTPARNEQVVGRIRRAGQRAERVRVHHIVAKDTTDAVAARALVRKESIIEALALAVPV